MRTQRGGGRAIDFGMFGSPWTGMAAMILVQASTDLEALGDQDKIIDKGIVVKRDELLKFFRSKWAWHLATSCGLEPEELQERGVLTWAG